LGHIAKSLHGKSAACRTANDFDLWLNKFNELRVTVLSDEPINQLREERKLPPPDRRSLEEDRDIGQPRKYDEER